MVFVVAQKLQASDRALAPSGVLENFYGHVQKSLQDLGFIDTAHPVHRMFSLRQLFGRARLDSRDVSILRGILSQIERSSKIENK
jgi:tRNA C32,U32 (ribose-2'-O)-methylase TrmJ